MPLAATHWETTEHGATVMFKDLIVMPSEVHRFIFPSQLLNHILRSANAASM